MSCMMEERKPTKTERHRCSLRQNEAMSHIIPSFIFASQLNSCIIDHFLTSAFWCLRKTRWRQNQWLFVFAGLKGKPRKYSCQHRGMLQDNGVSLHETSVVGNSADKIYNKHAKVQQPPPMSSCSTLVISDNFIGRQRDGGCSSSNNCSEQVFLFFLCNSEGSVN